MTQMYVTGEGTPQRVRVPVPSPETGRATVFAWTASTEESEGLRLTREILSDPGAAGEIAAAREEIARGDVVHGIDAVRALRPCR
jgi:hypothetical protein